MIGSFFNFINVFKTVDYRAGIVDMACKVGTVDMVDSKVVDTDNDYNKDCWHFD